MINPFGMINDVEAQFAGGYDEIQVSIYSDVIGTLFLCSTYYVKKRSLIDFKGLKVPCNEVVTITLTEKDTWFNEGHSVMVSCRERST
jgi:hypothetical protein